MRVDLFISGVSDTRKMSNCPKDTENRCGVMYRSF